MTEKRDDGSGMGDPIQKSIRNMIGLHNLGIEKASPDYPVWVDMPKDKGYDIRSTGYDEGWIDAPEKERLDVRPARPKGYAGTKNTSSKKIEDEPEPEPEPEPEDRYTKVQEAPDNDAKASRAIRDRWNNEGKFMSEPNADWGPISDKILDGSFDLSRIDDKNLDMYSDYVHRMLAETKDPKYGALAGHIGAERGRRDAERGRRAAESVERKFARTMNGLNNNTSHKANPDSGSSNDIIERIKENDRFAEDINRRTGFDPGSMNPSAPTPSHMSSEKLTDSFDRAPARSKGSIESPPNKYDKGMRDMNRRGASAAYAESERHNRAQKAQEGARRMAEWEKTGIQSEPPEMKMNREYDEMIKERNAKDPEYWNTWKSGDKKMIQKSGNEGSTKSMKPADADGISDTGRTNGKQNVQGDWVSQDEAKEVTETNTQPAKNPIQKGRIEDLRAQYNDVDTGASVSHTRRGVRPTGGSVSYESMGSADPGRYYHMEMEPGYTTRKEAGYDPDDDSVDWPNPEYKEVTHVAGGPSSVEGYPSNYEENPDELGDRDYPTYSNDIDEFGMADVPNRYDEPYPDGRLEKSFDQRVSAGLAYANATGQLPKFSAIMKGEYHGSLTTHSQGSGKPSEFDIAEQERAKKMVEAEEQRLREEAGDLLAPGTKLRNVLGVELNDQQIAELTNQYVKDRMRTFIEDNQLGRFLYPGAMTRERGDDILRVSDDEVNSYNRWNADDLTSDELRNMSAKDWEARKRGRKGDNFQWKRKDLTLEDYLLQGINNKRLKTEAAVDRIEENNKKIKNEALEREARGQHRMNVANQKQKKEDDEAQERAENLARNTAPDFESLNDKNRINRELDLEYQKHKFGEEEKRAKRSPEAKAAKYAKKYGPKPAPEDKGDEGSSDEKESPVKDDTKKSGGSFREMMEYRMIEKASDRGYPSPYQVHVSETSPVADTYRVVSMGDDKDWPDMRPRQADCRKR